MDRQSSKIQHTVIVDGDHVFSSMLESSLQKHGVQKVSKLPDAQSANAYFFEKIKEIDVIILDLNISNGEGIAVLKLAASLGFSGSILIACNHHQSFLDSAIQLARMLGLNNVSGFNKPVNFTVFGKQIADIHKCKSNRPVSPVKPEILDIALSKLQVEAHFQARVDLRNINIVGAEALARIRDEEGQYLNTQEIIAHAEQTGKINELTWKMLDNLVRGKREINACTGKDLPLSININGKLLADAEFVSALIRFADDAKLNPETIVLEQTETGLPPDPTAALEAFMRLRIHGFGLALDDFGTGYANIDHMKIFPFNELKIDRSFVTNAKENAFSRECISAAVRLAKEQNMTVTAEGIENRYELHLAKAHRIEFAQGYLFSRPLPLHDFITLLGKNQLSETVYSEKMAG